MFLVVILHILGQGGILKGVQTEGRFAITWFMEIVAYCAVDCYALISGFVGFSEKPKAHKYSRWILLWMQVVFYCMLITLILYFILPGKIGFKAFVKAIMPVSFNNYWYFTAYTGVFIFMPWFNKLLRNTGKRELKSLILWMIVIFSFYPTAVSIINDPFHLVRGYSFLWLAILYVLGAYIRKYDVYKEIKKNMLLMVGIILLLFTWIWKLGIGRLFVSKLAIEDMFISYISPTILGFAIVLLILFAQMNIKIRARKWIISIAPSAFGVYLIHTQPLLFEYVLKGRFTVIAELSAWLIPIVVLGLAALIFICGILIDKIRKVIFETCRLNLLAQEIENWGRKIAKRFSKE